MTVDKLIPVKLPKAEELHALRVWLWFGGDGLIRRKQEEDQSEPARCLTLLTSAVLLWNTVYMQDVLRQLQAEGYAVDDTHFDYSSPCRDEHIIRLGKYPVAGSGELNATRRRPLRDPTDKLSY